NASRARVSRSPVLRTLCESYAHELRAQGWNDAEHRHEVGRRLYGGLVYDDALRAIYARALALGEDFGDVFGEAGTGAFLQWLEQPAPRGAGYGINRYVFYRVSRERADVLRAYPDLDDPDDAAGFLAWCRAFGQAELGIPERFMPWQGGAPPAPPRAGRAREARRGLRPGKRVRGRAAAEAGQCRHGRRAGGASHRLHGAHARSRRGGARLCRRARRRGRTGEHDHRAAAPPRAAGRLGGRVWRTWLRGPRARRAPRLRDRCRQRG